MGIFRRRPMAFFCLCFTAVFLFASILSLGWAISLAMLTLGAGALLSYWLLKKRLAGKHAAAVVLLFSLMMTAAFLRASLWFAPQRTQAETLENQAAAGEIFQVTGSVERVSSPTAYASSYFVKLQTVNGESVAIGALLRCAFVGDLALGDIFALTGTFSALHEDGADLAAQRWYASQGVFTVLTVSSAEDLTVTAPGTDTLSARLAALNETLAERLCTAVGGGEAGNLCAALLLGNRSALADTTVRDFRRTGASQLLALSGLHLTLIVGFFLWLLDRMLCPKKVRLILSALFAIFYLLLTGASITAARAVLMLLAIYAAGILAAHADTLTSLGLAAVVLLTISPGTILDAGFWLSFCAVSGIGVYSEWKKGVVVQKTAIHGKHRKVTRMVQHFCGGFRNALGVSAVATVAVLAPLAVYYGEISLLSLPSALLLTPMTELVLVLSLLALPIGATGGFLSLPARAAEATAKGMLALTEEASSWSGIVHTLQNPVAWIAISLFACALFLMATLSLKACVLKRFACISALSLAVVFGSTWLVLELRSAQEAIILTESTNESILLKDDSSTWIFDIGTGSYTSFRMAIEAAALDDCFEFDGVVLTHYHRAHLSSLSRLFSHEIIRSLHLPAPETDEDEILHDEIVVLAETYGIPVVDSPTGYETPLTDAVSCFQAPLVRLYRSTQPLILFSLKMDDYRLTYLGASFWEREDYGEDFEELAEQSDTVVYGWHGPRPIDTYPLAAARAGQTLCFPIERLLWLAQEEDVQDLPPDIRVVAGTKKWCIDFSEATKTGDTTE